MSRFRFLCRLGFAALAVTLVANAVHSPARAQGAPSPSITGEFLWNGGLYEIGAYAAYDLGVTGQGVTLAVLDTGINYFHPELFTQVADGGFDFYDDDFDYMDYNGHGSLVSGIIAAKKNDWGIHGVAYNSRILPIKVTSDDGKLLSFDALRNGVYHAVQEGAAAINYSATFARNDGFLIDDLAVQAGDLFAQTSFGGTVIVTSAGNSAAPNPIIPGLLPYVSPAHHDSGIYSIDPAVVRDPGTIDWSYSRGGILTVAAADRNGVISSFSNHCGVAAEWCLTAPGEDVISTFWFESFIDMKGTSLAAPYVTGAIGLLKELYPHMTGPQIAALLLATAKKDGIYADQSIYGQGFLDIQNAVSPQGLLRVVENGGSAQAASVLLAGSYLDGSSALGGSLSLSLAAQNRELVVADAYDRPYRVALESLTLAPAQPQGALEDMRGEIDLLRLDEDLRTVSFGESLSLTAPLAGFTSRLNEPLYDEDSRMPEDAALNWDGSSFTLGIAKGRAARESFQDPFPRAGGSSQSAIFTPGWLDMAADGYLVTGHYALGGGLGLETDWRQGSSLDDTDMEATAVTAGLRWQPREGSKADDSGHVLLRAGSVTEESSMLGLASGGIFALKPGSVTGFAGAEAAWPLLFAHGEKLRITTSFYAGDTTAQGAAQSLVREVSAQSRQAALGIEGRGIWQDGDKLAIVAERPLHVFSGRMALDAFDPDAPDGEGLDLDLATTRVPRTLHLFYDAPLPEDLGGDFGLHAAWRKNAGQAETVDDASVLFHVRLKI